jgi:hypothetical protein
MGFSEECNMLNNAFTNNNTIFDFTSIYNFHKSIYDLCLKYPCSVNTNEIIQKESYYFTGSTNFHKSKFIYHHINKLTNKFILDVYIINNQYYINEEYILKILIDPKIQNYQNIILKTHFVPQLNTNQHCLLENITCTFSDKKYYYIGNAPPDNLKINVEINYINFKTYKDEINELRQELYNKDIALQKCQEHNTIQNTRIQKLEREIKNINMNYNNITNSFADIINDLQDQINKLKMQINNNSDVVIYDYEEIKQKNKALNNEFKRLAKLMKLC